MSYRSAFFDIDVRDSIAKEFTNSVGETDDMMAGLHEVRVRKAEKENKIKKPDEDLSITGILAIR